jgi:multidrug resistance protein
MQQRKTLMILALIMLVNALSYGTIIPLLYPYSAQFGINPIGLSLLFTSFSLFQFVATPIIGRLSDRYGRRPLLVLSIFGTCISLALFASARSIPWLFASRILDGITGGNMSVAQAVIADSTSGKKRAEAFGMLGASYGFGFLLGPAMGGFLGEFGLSTPFWFASGLAFVAGLLTYFLLPETFTISKTSRQTSLRNEPLFNFKRLYQALLTPFTGVVLLLTFLLSLGQHSFYIGFQTFTNDVLNLSVAQIGSIFTLVGIVSIVVQAKGIGLLLKWVDSKKLVIQRLLYLSTALIVVMYFSTSSWQFTVLTLLFIAVFSPVLPLLSGVLSERTKAEDQGGMMGINQSYLSLGQIFGPIIAGTIAYSSVPSVFLGSGAILVMAILVARKLNIEVKGKFDL